MRGVMNHHRSVSDLDQAGTRIAGPVSVSVSVSGLRVAGPVSVSGCESPLRGLRDLHALLLPCSLREHTRVFVGGKRCAGSACACEAAGGETQTAHRSPLTLTRAAHASRYTRAATAHATAHAHAYRKPRNGRCQILVVLCSMLLFLSAGCEDRSYRDIGAQINALTKPGGRPPSEAIAQLARIGRRALPQIETALHTASPRGKSNLVKALDAIGEPEAAPIVQHFAVYDPSPEVRTECEEMLNRWAGRGDRRAERARLALQRVAAKRAKGEGPEL